MRSSPVIVGAARGGLLKGRAAVNSLGFGPLQRLLSAVNRRHGDHSQDSRIPQQEALTPAPGDFRFGAGAGARTASDVTAGRDELRAPRLGSADARLRRDEAVVIGSSAATPAARRPSPPPGRAR